MFDNFFSLQLSICGDEVIESKPSSYPLLTLCKQVGVSPHECIVVGDTSADMGMGQNSNAGLIVGVLSGSGTANQLFENGAHLVVPDVSYLVCITSMFSAGAASGRQHTSSTTSDSPEKFQKSRTVSL
jgi:Predicted phosphatases